MKRLESRPLGATGLAVSLLGFGALEIGRDWAADVNPDPSHPGMDEAGIVLNGVLDRGITFIDTAPAYWNSEEFMGQTIAHRRDSYCLATKVGEHCDREGSYYDYSAEATVRFIDRSLQRLKTDIINLIQIHSASVEVLEKGETWQTLDAARRAGKVRFIGMTGKVEAALRAAELGGYDTVQVTFNLLDASAAHRLFPLCVEKDIGVIIMRGLAGGKLTAKFRNLTDGVLREQIAALDARARLLYGDSDSALPRLALRFIKAQSAVSTMIIGTRRLAAVDANQEMLEGQITAEEAAVFRELAGLT